MGLGVIDSLCSQRCVCVCVGGEGAVDLHLCASVLMFHFLNTARLLSAALNAAEWSVVTSVWPTFAHSPPHPPPLHVFVFIHDSAGMENQLWKKSPPALESSSLSYRDTGLCCRSVCDVSTRMRDALEVTCSVGVCQRLSWYFNGFMKISSQIFVCLCTSSRYTASLAL